MSFFKSRIKSFGYALEGIGTLIVTQRNAQIHLLATLVVIGTGLWLQLHASDWILLFTSISIVWIAEALNTAIEYLADAQTKEQHPLIKKAKDVAAAAVLIAALNSVITAAFILQRWL